MQNLLGKKYVLLLVLTIGNTVGCHSSEDGKQRDADNTDQIATITTFTIDDVNAIRSQTKFDERALDIEGVVGVGSGGSNENHAWINVMCANETCLVRAKRLLGSDIEGVPIRYEISGNIHAQ